ncbi:helix-turn-helix domain-containing protein [Erythrobacter sp. 3-20A1M]|uniref:helix-turn-helix domain-containing protein n=1 Tax=Erythrobacter sp. 3-20A1M TaxID=2653850 RepID=UPI001BFC0529|nr:helix-turn-helix transcriptional regulator [Erythrobacter sp. 3-20A1M]QWC56494.1 helix-turn-helix domain-containing protein [Erythrobacter sp. 3-20A1M]
MKKVRMLLPRDFCALRENLGDIIRERRLAYENGTGLSQQELADIAGIRRESLSRIESGRRWPSYDALYQIMGVLSLEWHDIAHKGVSERPARLYASERRQDLGSALRAGRLKEGLTLQELARRTGLSASQLSRLERSQSVRSGLLKMIDPGKPVRPGEPPDPVFQFVHPELARLVKSGMMISKGHRT